MAPLSKAKKFQGFFDLLLTSILYSYFNPTFAANESYEMFQCPLTSENQSMKHYLDTKFSILVKPNIESKKSVAVAQLRQKLTGLFSSFPKYMLVDKVQNVGITCSYKNCRKLIIYAWNDTTLHWKGKKKVNLTVLLLKYIPSYFIHTLACIIDEYTRLFGTQETWRKKQTQRETKTSYSQEKV